MLRRRWNPPEPGCRVPRWSLRQSRSGGPRWTTGGTRRRFQARRGSAGSERRGSHPGRGSRGSASGRRQGCRLLLTRSTPTDPAEQSGCQSPAANYAARCRTPSADQRTDWSWPTAERLSTEKIGKSSDIWKLFKIFLKCLQVVLKYQKNILKFCCNILEKCYRNVSNEWMKCMSANTISCVSFFQGCIHFIWAWEVNKWLFYSYSIISLSYSIPILFLLYQYPISSPSHSISYSIPILLLLLYCIPIPFYPYPVLSLSYSIPVLFCCYPILIKSTLTHYHKLLQQFEFFKKSKRIIKSCQKI